MVTNGSERMSTSGCDDAGRLRQLKDPVMGPVLFVLSAAGEPHGGRVPCLEGPQRLRRGGRGNGNSFDSPGQYASHSFATADLQALRYDAWSGHGPAVRHSGRTVGRISQQLWGLLLSSGMRALLCVAWLPVVACLGAPSAAAGQGSQVSIESTADRTVVRIGDAITYRVTVQYDSSLVLAASNPEEALGIFEIRDHTSEQMEAEPGRLAITEEFTLANYAPGCHKIGPRVYLVQSPDGNIDTLATAAIPVEVISTLPADAEDVQDIKGPLEIPSEVPVRWIVLLAAGGLAVAAALVWFIRRRRRRLPVIEMPPARPAHEVAYEALEELRQLDLAGSGQMKAYYIALSETLRRYLGARYGLPAMDRTTTEMLQLLRRRECATESTSAVREVLEASDQAKFARRKGTLEEASTTIDRVFWIVDQTRSGVEPPVAAAASA